MKRLLGLILALCLVFSLTADALAATKMQITKQPESATTNQKGTVSFSIGYKGSVTAITWYFINPATGEKVTAKKIPPAMASFPRPFSKIFRSFFFISV